MRHLWKKLLLVGLLALPGTVLAAPWCLVRDALENCNLWTAEACYDKANRMGGYCKPNPRELGIRGTANYCVITATTRRCVYGSRGVCLNVAREMNGGCVRNTEKDLERRARGAERAADTDFESLGSGEDLGAAGYGPGG